MNRDAKLELLKQTAEIGKANGLRCGAEVLLALTQGRKKIDAGELRGAAIALEDAYVVHERNVREIWSKKEVKDG